MRLTIRKSEGMPDWYVIERAKHDGREWEEQIGQNSYAYRTSARFSDADVEGTGAEMKAIARAIKERGSVRFKRCAVHMRENAIFHSPRNSQVDGICSIAEADELADLIFATILESR